MNFSEIYSTTKKFISDNLSDCIFVSVLTILVLTLLFTTIGYYGDPIIDCGRELYLPTVMLKGKILFKDIFGMYNPFGYQINMLLFTIFGSSVTTLKVAGVFNTYLIVILLYGISRFFIKPVYAFSICMMLFFYFIFSAFSVINFVMPYSYSFVYALSFFLASVIFFIMHCKNSEKYKLSAISYLLLGLSLACKPEYSLAIVPYIVIQILNKDKIKHIFFNILLFVLPTLLSYGVLFIQGLTLNDISEYLTFIINLFNTEEQIYYDKNYLSFSLTTKNVLLLVINCIFALCFYYCLCALMMIYLNISARKYKITFGILYLILAYNISFFMFKYIHLFNIYSWIGIGLILLIVFKKDDKLLRTLAIIALLSAIRVKAIFLNIFSCQTYLILLPLTIFLIYFFKYIKDEKIKLSFAITMIILSLSVSVLRWDLTSAISRYTIETDNRGLMMNKRHIAKVLNKTIQWVQENTKENDVIVTLPEGIYINYITGRPANLKYYHLIPNHIKALGEDKIVKGLLKDMPEYFIINNEPYFTYEKHEICYDFGEKICEFVNTNYIIEEVISEPQGYKMTIYKKK